MVMHSSRARDAAQADAPHLRFVFLAQISSAARQLGGEDWG